MARLPFAARRFEDAFAKQRAGAEELTPARFGGNPGAARPARGEDSPAMVAAAGAESAETAAASSVFCQAAAGVRRPAGYRRRTAACAAATCGGGAGCCFAAGGCLAAAGRGGLRAISGRQRPARSSRHPGYHEVCGRAGPAAILQRQRRLARGGGGSL